MLSPFSVSLVEFEVLVAISRRPFRTTAADIAHERGEGRTSAARVTARLVERGLLQADRWSLRRTYLSLTDLGRRLLADALRQVES